jgi:hypothetical protein
MGNSYREPTLVLFSGAVQSACGLGQAAMGPFYCPGDSKVYIDLSFFDDLRKRHGAPGDFAQAYVIAHEVGHHVQNLLGISRKVHEARSRSGREEGNRLSVRQELQADCLAGVWAHHADRARNVLERGDVEEALRAAAMIGDGIVHPWHIGAAHALVSTGHRFGASCGLRHLQRRAPLTTGALHRLGTAQRQRHRIRVPARVSLAGRAAAPSVAPGRRPCVTSGPGNRGELKCDHTAIT